ncbi:monooxygenase [Trapelia coarctata]|nr:monooxygenase [Trapelia coarctata]
MSCALNRDRPLDLVIIGAGLYGICAARNYLEIHPEFNVSILEESSCVGGVWSSERAYDDFWTQTVIGMAEFSDGPLTPLPEKDVYYDFFPARYVTSYLERYIDSHVYNGQSLRSRINFGCLVDEVKKSADTWMILCNQRSLAIKAARLIVTTGLTSMPNMPALPNQDAFLAPIIHQKDFSQSAFLDSADVINVSIIGGGKSAADIVYAAAKSGKTVSWIIRKRGSGPAAHAPAKGNAIYRNANELLYNRFSSSFSPSVFQSTWLIRFLHQSRLGRGITSWVWSKIDAQYRETADYGRADSEKTGFALLEPDSPLFWQNDSTGINQKPDFWDTIASKVKVYRQDILTLKDHSIQLENGDLVSSDLLICATGWQPSLSFFTSTEAAELGLSTLQLDMDPEKAQKWKDLDEQTDREVVQQFPALANPPAHAPPDTSRTPFRLYKMIASPNDPTIAFLGHINVGNSFRAAECQALWVVAYFDGNLNLPPKTAMEHEISRAVSWCRRRYPYRGASGVWLYYDLLPYTDDLLAHIGLTSHRKRGLKDLFSPCFARDLRDLQEEYKAKSGEGGELV